LVISVPTTGRPGGAVAPVAGQHVQQVVAVDRSPAVVDHQHAIAVAIEGDAEIGRA
jgi:hypothetical protein